MIGTILRALAFGLLALIVIPVALSYGILLLGHLGGSCGAGSSGGCEMGAAALAIAAALPAFVLGAGLSVWRDRRAGRRPRV